MAYVLSTASPRVATIGFVFLLLPFWTSILVRTYAWMILLGRNGVLNPALLEAGMIDSRWRCSTTPPASDRHGARAAALHGLSDLQRMLRVDPDLLLAAEGLGASGWQMFRRIYLPLTMPGVIAGTALVFILSLGFYITPALLGGGKVIMIAVLIEQQVRQFSSGDLLRRCRRCCSAPPSRLSRAAGLMERDRMDRRRAKSPACGWLLACAVHGSGLPVSDGCRC